MRREKQRITSSGIKDMKSNNRIPRLSDFNESPSEQFPTVGIHFDPDDDDGGAGGSGGVDEQQHGGGAPWEMGRSQKEGKNLGAREAIRGMRKA